jgi:Flp pilus assembly protein TadG
MIAKLPNVSLRFARDLRGVAAVEFALIAPLMLTIFFGTVELATGLAVDRKVTLVSRSLSDLVAQATAVNDADLTNVFNAATAIMTPYAASPMAAKITAVSIDGSGKATVAWSKSWTTAGMTSGYSGGTVVTSSIPAGLIVNNTQLIWSEVTYAYTPTIGYVVKSMITLTDKFYARPRQSTSVTYS